MTMFTTHDARRTTHDARLTAPRRYRRGDNVALGKRLAPLGQRERHEKGGVGLVARDGAGRRARRGHERALREHGAQDDQRGRVGVDGREPRGGHRDAQPQPVAPPARRKRAEVADAQEGHHHAVAEQRDEHVEQRHERGQEALALQERPARAHGRAVAEGRGKDARVRQRVQQQPRDHEVEAQIDASPRLSQAPVQALAKELEQGKGVVGAEQVGAQHEPNGREGRAQHAPRVADPLLDGLWGGHRLSQCRRLRALSALRSAVPLSAAIS